MELRPAGAAGSREAYPSRARRVTSQQIQRKKIKKKKNNFLPHFSFSRNVFSRFFDQRAGVCVWPFAACPSRANQRALSPFLSVNAGKEKRKNMPQNPTPLRVMSPVLTSLLISLFIFRSPHIVTVYSRFWVFSYLCVRPTVDNLSRLGRCQNQSKKFRYATIFGSLPKKRALLCVCAKSLQSCPTLWDSIGCRPLGSLCPWDSQAKILEWVAVPSSRDGTLKSFLLHLPAVSLPLAPPARKGRSSQNYSFSSSQVWMWEFYHKESWYNEVDETGAYYTEWSKPEGKT